VGVGQRDPFLYEIRKVVDARPEQVAPDLIRIVEQCTATFPKDRPSVDEVVERLRAVLEFTKRMGTAGERKTSDGHLAPPDHSSLGDLVSSAKNGIMATIKPSTLRTRIEAAQNAIGSLLEDFADGPSVEACDAARERAYERLGTIDRKMLVGEQVATAPLYIVHRSNGNVALASRGLADPPHVDRTTTGLGLELWGEASEAEVGTGAQLGASILFQILHEVAGNAKQIGMRLRQLLDLHGLVSMELNNVDAPPLYVDPNTGRTCVLLGIPSVDLPDSFFMPGGLRVRLVTVRLLTFEECLVIRRFSAAGRKALADLFQQDESRHISTTRHVPAGPNTLNLLGFETKDTVMEMDSRGSAPSAFAGRSQMPPVLTVHTARPLQETMPPAPPLPQGLLHSPVLPIGPLMGMPPAESVVWDADRLREKLIELKVPIPIANRSAAIDSTVSAKLGPPVSVVIPVLRLLPPYDEKSYEPSVSPAVTFREFAKPNLLSEAMGMFDMRLRFLSAAPPPTSWTQVSAAVGLAKHMVNTLHTQTQIAGWVHFEEYVADSDRYIIRMARRGKLHGDTVGAAIPFNPTEAAMRPVGALQPIGEAIVKRLLARVQWVAELLARARQTFDPDLCLHVIGSDGDWMDESGRFMKHAEAHVTELLKKNSARFGVFRDLQRRGVAWPHNALLRRDVEAAGFQFQPMMVKRDRCVCDTCGIEVSGWRPWFNPWHLHHLPRHDNAFAERVARCGPAFAPSGLFAIPSSWTDPAQASAAATAAAAAAAVATAASSTVRPPVARPVIVGSAAAKPV